ncbi:MAG: hypothetical protein ACRD2Y_08045 [Terriglobales bacterium]
MKQLRWAGAVTALVFLTGLSAPASGDKTPPTMVDSGSFGIFVGGKRVATETFEITTQPEGSHARAEFKTTEGSSVQTADLLLHPNGDLRRYEWREQGKAQVVVELKNEFVVETVTLSDSPKPTEIPFLLSASTAVVDDNFFIHRQILAWKYLATGCAPGSATAQGCVPQKTQFGVIVPQQQRPSVISMEYAGKETLKLAGGERELRRFKLETEGVEWALWLDEQHKMVRVLIASQHIEVLRD